MKKENLRCIFLILLMGLTVVVWMNWPGNRVHSKHEYLVTKYYRFETVGKEEIVQEFVPQFKILDKIELFIANLYPETDGNINISITDQRNNVIFQNKYKACKIPTGEFVDYKIGKKIVPGNRYTLKLSYDGSAEEKPQVMVSERKKNLDETKTMYTEDAVSDYNMAITYHYVW